MDDLFSGDTTTGNGGAKISEYEIWDRWLEFKVEMILQNKGENADVLNQSPGKMNAEVSLNRNESKYENNSKKFQCLKRDFRRQFAHIYAGRLAAMKPRLVEASVNKWGNGISIKQLSDLSEDCNEKCIVIGTLFKHQELKPSILKEISEEHQITPQPVLSSYMSENDVLILEDEIQRILLIGNFQLNKLVTGIVVGLLGFENDEGKFVVEDLCFAGVNAPMEKPLSLSTDCYVLLVSGLNLRSMQAMLALELLIDWIKGNCGSPSDQQKSSQITRVIIAGNSVGSSKSYESISVINTDIDDEVDTLTAVKQLDEVLSDLAETIEVDIMPGDLDPANHIMPQQAFYECIFPSASQYSTFHCVTNPYECTIEGFRFLGSSGQPVQDIKTLTEFTDGLEILENTLSWGHIAPTAPDTLGCYPYYNEDPFILTQQPHVYFAANQSEYSAKTVSLNGHSTRLICIPTFFDTRTCVLFNLKTSASTPLTFKV